MRLSGGNMTRSWTNWTAESNLILFMKLGYYTFQDH